jgi:hypothetical protein
MKLPNPCIYAQKRLTDFPVSLFYYLFYKLERGDVLGAIGKANY